MEEAAQEAGNVLKDDFGRICQSPGQCVLETEPRYIKKVVKLMLAFSSRSDHLIFSNRRQLDCIVFRRREMGSEHSCAGSWRNGHLSQRCGCGYVQRCQEVLPECVGRHRETRRVQRRGKPKGQLPEQRGRGSKDLRRKPDGVESVALFRSSISIGNILQFKYFVHQSRLRSIWFSLTIVRWIGELQLPKEHLRPICG